MYGGSAVLILAIISGIVFFRSFYHAPSCTDGVKNGSETGVDCGGGCPNVCTTDTLNPIVLWAKSFNISGDVYTAVAYVENPNVNSRNDRAQYDFRMYDSSHTLIESRTGETYIPKNKKFAIFETGFLFKNKKPRYTEFSFTSFSEWKKDTSVEPDLVINYGSLLATSTSPRIEGTVLNNSLQNIPYIELVGFVIDSRDNVVAASKTFLNNVNKLSTQSFTFTWPKSFDLGVEACASPLDVALLLDTSGSMKSEKQDPPEPFSTVKSTAEEFIKSFSDNDQVSVISFGNKAVEANTLTSDKQIAITSIENLSLGTTSQQTNITDALGLAKDELAKNGRKISKKIIVLLTDGAPTEPQVKGEPDYPKISALASAQDIVRSGTTIYTIGLGTAVNEGFLKDVSGDSNNYFFAPNKETLSSIYSSLNASLCERVPNVINVMYRIP